MVSLYVTHGAERDPRNPNRWESYLFDNERVIVLAKTEPNTRDAWRQIQWHAVGGEPITGFGNGYRFPRSTQKDYEISASLGGVTITITLSVTTLVRHDSHVFIGGKRGTPVRPLATGRMINLYGEHETDDVNFEDYVVIKDYQQGAKQSANPAKDLRPLTRAPITSPAPDGPGLPNDCASDIFLRSCPFYSPSYFAIQRIRSKERCRITYFESERTELQRFRDAFSDASHLQSWIVQGTNVEVVEYPKRAAWTAPSDLDKPAIPPPDKGMNAAGPIRRTEEEGLIPKPEEKR
jgi:hypothetical protein